MYYTVVVEFLPIFSFIFLLMTNFGEMAMLFAINNFEKHKNNNIYYERQTRNLDIVTDPFTLSDRLFIKTLDLLKPLLEI